ncbi:hypothetical protein H9P43_008298 [Blastocladiella emersonii ATCC 22665]|nr:hypothetical protein H9P43_008298 [Blastocladiella emersonii ATCC 22665]
MPTVDTSAARLDQQFELMMRELAMETEQLSHAPPKSPGPGLPAPGTFGVPRPDSAVPLSATSTRRPSLPSYRPDEFADMMRQSHHSDDSGRGSFTRLSSGSGLAGPSSHGTSVMTHGSTGSMSMALTLEDQGAAGADFLAQMLGDLHTLYADDSDDEASAAAPQHRFSDGSAPACDPATVLGVDPNSFPIPGADHVPAAAEPPSGRRPSIGGPGGAANSAARNRSRAVHELLSTEQTYVDMLSALVDLVLKPLREALAATNGGGTIGKRGSLGYSADDLSKIFGNVEEILGLHVTLLAGLRERYSLWTSDSKISDIFLTIVPFFRMYQLYMSRYATAMATLARCRKVSSDLAKVIAHAESHARFKGLTVLSFLILPIQRIPRYILLLDNLAKYTDESHPDSADLKRCVAEVKKIADQINEAIRGFESQKRAIAVQACVVGRPGHYPALVAPARKFLGEAEFTMRAKNTLANAGLGLVRDDRRHVHVFLFSDLLVIAKRVTAVRGSDEERYDFKDEMILARTWVAGEDVPTTPSSPRAPPTPTSSSFGSSSAASEAYPLRLMGHDRLVTLFAPTREQRDEWAGKISAAIDDLRDAGLTRGRTLGRPVPALDDLSSGAAHGFPPVPPVPASPTGSTWSGRSSSGFPTMNDNRSSRSSSSTGGGVGGTSSWFWAPGSAGGAIPGSPTSHARRPSVTSAYSAGGASAGGMPPSPASAYFSDAPNPSAAAYPRSRSTDAMHRMRRPSLGPPPVPQVPAHYDTVRSSGSSGHKQRERKKSGQTKNVLKSHGF